jgi:hypothetical protein
MTKVRATLTRVTYAYRARKQAKGLCISGGCWTPAVKGCQHCEACQQKAREWQQRRNLPGVIKRTEEKLRKLRELQKRFNAKSTRT